MSEINYNVRKLATDVDRAESVLSALETSAELAIAKFFAKRMRVCGRQLSFLLAKRVWRGPGLRDSFDVAWPSLPPSTNSIWIV